MTSPISQLPSLGRRVTWLSFSQGNSEEVRRPTSRPDHKVSHVWSTMYDSFLLPWDRRRLGPWMTWKRTTLPFWTAVQNCLCEQEISLYCAETGWFGSICHNTLAHTHKYRVQVKLRQHQYPTFDGSTSLLARVEDLIPLTQVFLEVLGSGTGTALLILIQEILSPSARWIKHGCYRPPRGVCGLGVERVRDMLWVPQGWILLEAPLGQRFRPPPLSCPLGGAPWAQEGPIGCWMEPGKFWMALPKAKARMTKR